MRSLSGTVSRAVLCGLLAFALTACNEAQPKKTYVEVPKKPEMVPGAKPGAETTPGKPGGATGAPPPYLPPSERGARVEASEAPEGSPPPTPAKAPAQAQAPTAAAQRTGGPGAPPGGAKAGGDVGGNMPTTAGAPTYRPPPGMAPADQPAHDSMGNLQPPDASLPESRLPAADFKPEPGSDAARNEKLKAQMGEFDAAMRRAQAEAAKERAGNAAPQPADIDRSGAPGRSTGTGNMPGEKHGNERSDYDPRALATGERPHGPARGEAENIVARQLRQAAERESDPVLREKLWAEYRRYVGGTGTPQ